MLCSQINMVKKPCHANKEAPLALCTLFSWKEFPTHAKILLILALIPTFIVLGEWHMFYSCFDVRLKS